MNTLMDNAPRPSDPLASSGLVLAPIHSPTEKSPLRVCILARREPDSSTGRFVLLRELPSARVYLGALCDAAERVQDWLEIRVQTSGSIDLASAADQAQLTNSRLDERWQSEFDWMLSNMPEMVLVTGCETGNPRPILIRQLPANPSARVASTAASDWQLCRDDALLQAAGLPVYSTSPFRYLYQPTATSAKNFIVVSSNAPVNDRVLPLDTLKAGPDVIDIFNPAAGLLLVQRFAPLDLESFLQILEGRPWTESDPNASILPLRGPYVDLRAWSGQPKGLPFLLHSAGTEADHLNEVFFLRLSLLLGVFKQVQSYVAAHQLPLLNLSPASFRLSIPDVGEQFPALWAAKCLLVKPSQAHAMPIAASDQKYFLRFGKVSGSVFLPEGLGAYSHGIGSVRRRNVLTEADKTVLEGTLVAEDYLTLDPHDILWFRLPLGDEPLECYAHVQTNEAVGPREARFRTLPMKLSGQVVDLLKNTVVFAKAPYAVWPLLSSPCDLYSLAIIAVRFLLANAESNLPVVVDDVIGLARFIGKETPADNQFTAKLRKLLDSNEKLANLVSPHALLNSDQNPKQGAAQIHSEIWMETIAWLLRLFPGAGAHSYCRSFGDVTPLALENAFGQPVRDLESLARRLRTVLVPTTAANLEMTEVILQQLATP